MSKKIKSKYYVVWVGQTPGVYNNWTDCQLQIKGFPNAKYKSFKSKEEAEKAFGDSAIDHYSINKQKENKDYLHFAHEIEMNSISVDAACSGNPGIMEYRGVLTSNKDEIFRIGPFKNGTNNIGEFLALVHGLAYLEKRNDSSTIIYTDSRTALSWIRNKKVKTTLKKTSQNKALFVLIDRALNWLHKNDFKNKIIKWNTEKWGEIPADFGRK